MESSQTPPRPREEEPAKVSPGGCSLLIPYLILGTLAIVFFPSVRSHPFLRPLSRLYSALFPDSWGVAPWVWKVFAAFTIVLTSVLAGLALTSLFNHLLRKKWDAIFVGLALGFISLLVTLGFGLFSLFL